MANARARTLFVDSSFASVADDGGSYVLDLGGQAIEVRENTKCFVDDVTFVHAWQNIETDRNDRLFLLTRWNPGRIWSGT